VGQVDILILQFLNALFYAAILYLIASGFTLIFGVMGIVNMAHGSFYALGAFVTAWVVGILHSQGVSPLLLLLLLPTGAFAVALFGMILEPILLRPFYKRAHEYQLLLTFGVLLIMEDSLQLIFGSDPLSADKVMDPLGSTAIFSFRYPNYNFVVIAVGIATAVALWAFIHRSRFGVILRATSQNMKMASALGINVGRVYVLAFGIGSFLAGLGGAIIVPTQTAVVGMGLDALIIAFVVVAIGGIGSQLGALLGALLVAFVRTAGVHFLPEVELAVLFLIAAGVLLWRPTGLFGKAG
jgi:branched-chain amino acid transport system permease protein